MRAEDEDLRLRQPSFDLDCSIEAVELRHGHVHHHNIGLECKGLLDGLKAGRGDATNFPTRLSLDHRARAFAHHVMIVGDENTQGRRSSCHCLSGLRAAVYSLGRPHHSKGNTRLPQQSLHPERSSGTLK